MMAGLRSHKSDWLALILLSARMLVIVWPVIDITTEWANFILLFIFHFRYHHPPVLFTARKTGKLHLILFQCIHCWSTWEYSLCSLDQQWINWNCDASFVLSAPCGWPCFGDLLLFKLGFHIRLNYCYFKHASIIQIQSVSFSRIWRISSSLRKCCGALYFNPLLRESSKQQSSPVFILRMHDSQKKEYPCSREFVLHFRCCWKYVTQNA